MRLYRLASPGLSSSLQNTTVCRGNPHRLSPPSTGPGQRLSPPGSLPGRPARLPCAETARPPRQTPAPPVLSDTAANLPASGLPAARMWAPARGRVQTTPPHRNAPCPWPRPQRNHAKTRSRGWFSRATAHVPGRPSNACVKAHAPFASPRPAVAAHHSPHREIKVRMPVG